MLSYKTGQVSAQLFAGSKNKQSGLANLFAVKPTPNTLNKKIGEEQIWSPVKPKHKKSPKQHAPVAGFPYVHETLSKSKSGKQKSPSPGKPAQKRKLEKTKEDEDNEEFQGKRPRRDRVRDRQNDARTIFIGNCPLSADRKVLKTLFKEFGEIESVRFRCAPPADPNLPRRAIVITKNFHEQCKNYIAYIVYKEEEAAKRALVRNGYLLDGLHLRVDISSQSKKHDKKRSVFVGNLPFDITEEHLYAHFTDCGEITNVRLVRDRKTSLGKGIGYVQFDSKDSVSLALKLNKTKLQGRDIRVMVCTNKPDKKDQKPGKKQDSAKKNKMKPKKPVFGPSNSTTSTFHAKLKMKREKRLHKLKKKKEIAKKSEGLASAGPTASRPKPKRKAKQNGSGKKSLKMGKKSVGQKRKKDFSKPNNKKIKGKKQGKKKN